jgi:hypothetical protein
MILIAESGIDMVDLAKKKNCVPPWRAKRTVATNTLYEFGRTTQTYCTNLTKCLADVMRDASNS